MIIRSEFVVPVNVITDFTHVFQIGFTFFMKNLDEGVHFFLHHTACPNNEKGCCSSFSLVEAYDNAVLELCGLENGQIMEFDDFTDVVQKKILASGKRKEICGNCQWNSICESQKSRWEKC